MKRIINMIDNASDLIWADRWVQVLDVINTALEKQVYKLYM